MSVKLKWKHFTAFELPVYQETGDPILTERLTGDDECKSDWKSTHGRTDQKLVLQGQQAITNLPEISFTWYAYGSKGNHQVYSVLEPDLLDTHVVPYHLSFPVSVNHAI